jgi:glycosyltransferase involved in cell wall biosynthesis
MSLPLAVTGGAARVGYVLKVFPRVSETFVINEVRALEALGESLRIFSLHRGDPAVPHGVLRELRSPVLTVEDELPDDVAVAAARQRLAHEFDPADRDALLPRKYVRLALRLAALVRTHGVGHLHAHFASRATHVAALAARLAGCSYSCTAHAKDIYHEAVDPRVLRWKLAGARFVVTVTDYNQAHLRRLVADQPDVAARVVRLYNGVDLTRFRPCAEPAAGPPLVLAVGRLVEKKGFPVLVEACRLLAARGVAFACEIIGGGPDEPALAAQIAAGGLAGTVTLRGVVPTEQVAARLADAAVVALPCVVARDGNVDALPTILLEAMASARPVVSTCLSGIPEIVVPGETGLLMPPGDAAALADALAALLDDPGRRRAMGQAGRRRAEHLFDLHANAAHLRRWLRAEMGA